MHSLSHAYSSVALSILLAPSALAQAPSTAPSSSQPNGIPLAEYESGTRMLVALPWKQFGKEPTQYAIDGRPESGALVIRFPFALAPMPVGADALSERDLAAMQKDRSWKKEKKTLTTGALTIAVPAEFQVKQLSIASQSGKTQLLQRNLYITTPEGVLLAIQCTLPTASVADGDACGSVAATLTMIPQPALHLGRDRQRAADMETPCSIVNGEVDRFRAANPSKKLSDMQRFAIANGVITMTAMSAKNSSLQSTMAISKALPDITAQTEAACRESPTQPFSAAFAEGTKRGLDMAKTKQPTN